MKTIALTSGEYRILELIAKSDFRSDADLSAPVWQVTETNQDKGYQTSCIKKGLVCVDDTTKGEETVWMTETGIKAYQEYCV